jgi:L-threonylcarbamoyladenylate synthase
LNRGGLVAFPTETVYGVGALALNATAVAGIFAVKARPAFDPVIVHIASAEGLDELASEVPPLARVLAERFWPGPLTLVLPKRAAVPDVVTAGLPSVGVRVPRHPVALALLKAAGQAIAAPSANPFGSVSPTTAQHVADGLGARIDLILDGGPCEVGVESTVLSLTGLRPRLLRPGGVTREELEAIAGPVDLGESDRVPEAPGQLATHYATRTPLRLVDPTESAPPPGVRAGLLRLSTAMPGHGYAAMETLSATGDLREAAANLFAALRRLDALGLELIVAECLPEEGLGVAIMDRLRRAAGSARVTRVS